ncbi:MAG: adaptor protein MecA [Ruminococcaceae bacterium]|nr:adaptor protein MecA [Oscillospiraceae bacterium]
MEWIRIGANKLKLMLSKEDASHYALSPESADYADAHTRKAFRSILTDIQRETGFDAAEDKVYIQMYPSREGGCELFITKMGLLLSEDAENTGEAESTPLRGRITPSLSQKHRLAFSFSRFEELIAVCRILRARDFSDDSEAWRSRDPRYFLFLAEHGTPAALQEKYTFLKEYGRSENATAARMRFPEHGICLAARDAVARLGAL